MKKALIFQNFGDNGLLINWPAKVDEAINAEVLQMDNILLSTFGKEIIETVPTYHSLAIYVKDKVKLSEFIKKIEKIPRIPLERKAGTKLLVRIPVCYNLRFGLDLKEIAALHKISTSEIIKLHTKEIYKVYFLGFLPGFPYLGGLNKDLCTPRKKLPRKLIEKGSVGIGGGQTGIYTSDSPGGWNIIGKCPLNFFSIAKSSICILKPGDYVKFVSISMKKYHQIEAEVAQGTYILRKEVYRD
jgi:inhibitor of KinA